MGGIYGYFGVVGALKGGSSVGWDTEEVRRVLAFANYRFSELHGGDIGCLEALTLKLSCHSLQIVAAGLAEHVGGIGVWVSC